MLKRIKAYIRINRLLKRSRKLTARFGSINWTYIALADKNAERNWRDIQRKVLFDTKLAEYVLERLDDLDRRYNEPFNQ